MAVEMFLKLEGVQGDPDIKGEMEVLSYSWGLNQALGVTPTGAAAGKVNVSEFSIVKQLDAASPKLMEMCCRGEHSAFATLSLRQAGGDKQQDFFKIKLTDVLISSYQTSTMNGGLPTEQVSFSFNSVEMQATNAGGQFQPSTSCDFAKGH